MRNRVRWGTGLAVVAALGAAAAGHCQETLTEIVVTAQKREQNLQEVPVAVDAFSGGELSDSGLVQPLELAAMTPNLSTKNAVGNTAPIFALRGIGLNDFATNGTQPVGVYLDEVYLVNNSQLSFQMMDLERVEVLVHPDNEASLAVCERAGFTREGLLRSYAEIRGRRVDLVVHSLLPADLR